MTLPLAVTMGDPAGVGGEITLKAWKARREHRTPVFFAIDDIERLRDLAGRLDWDVQFSAITEPGEAMDLFASALPVLHRPLPVPSDPGQLDPRNGKTVIQSIEAAVGFVQNGQAGAVVTNPIHKHCLHEAGFRHPGHTEFLAHLAGIKTPPVMMLACDQLRVVPVTIHVSLAMAARTLTTDDIITQGEITAQALTRDFGIATPRLAVAGLNPHAGESGAMGEEDLIVVAPAVEALQAKGIDARGPLPADTLFHPAARATYDVALCMYHDQALIPIKTLDFDGGVNVTLGLPFIRTSPDHGTALDIAGTGQANPRSFMAALSMAADMAARRSAA